MWTIGSLFLLCYWLGQFLYCYYEIINQFCELSICSRENQNLCRKLFDRENYIRTKLHTPHCTKTEPIASRKSRRMRMRLSSEQLNLHDLLLQRRINSFSAGIYWYFFIFFLVSRFSACSFYSLAKYKIKIIDSMRSMSNHWS